MRFAIAALGSLLAMCREDAVSGDVTVAGGESRQFHPSSCVAEGAEVSASEDGRVGTGITVHVEGGFQPDAAARPDCIRFELEDGHQITAGSDACTTLSGELRTEETGSAGGVVSGTVRFECAADGYTARGEITYRRCELD